MPVSTLRWVSPATDVVLQRYAIGYPALNPNHALSIDRRATRLALMATGAFREVSPKSTDYWVRIGAVTGIIAIAVQEISDFSLQMPGNAVLFAVLGALAVRPPRKRMYEPPSGQVS